MLFSCVFHLISLLFEWLSKITKRAIRRPARSIYNESMTTCNFIGRAAWGEIGAQGEMGSHAYLTLCSNLAPCRALYEVDWGRVKWNPFPRTLDFIFLPSRQLETKVDSLNQSNTVILPTVSRTVQFFISIFVSHEGSRLLPGKWKPVVPSTK